MKHLGIHSQSYYDILEVSPQAPLQEIHRAYQRARVAYSPDSPALYTMFTPEEAKELLRLVEEAFTVLGHEERRRAYDEQLLREKAMRELPDFPDPQQDEELSSERPLQGQPETHREAPQTAPAFVFAREPQLPQGHARTRLSTYPLNSEMEEEIKQTREFNGPTLQKIRSYKRISVDQICDETRIGKSYLVALEKDDFESLPAAVFVRGFVVQVARLLGLDEKLVADSYMKNFKKYKN